MKPVKLRLIGLRSYRSLQEIDFSDVDLMAIIGDTGAGKSSILEAICVALYGCCTWDARSAKPLIADGVPTMQVELTFLSGGHAWRVTRAISRGAYPPAVHRLEGLDDGTRVDNADPVNRAVERLIGLDFQTFLKAVVLPQGKFQILLQMSNTDRTPILKSILGLDALTWVREQAFALSGRLGPQLNALEMKRARLLTDPQAAADDARARLTTSTAQVAECDMARAAIARARTAEAAATARSLAAHKAAERIFKARVDNAERIYAALCALDATLKSEQSQLEGNEFDLEGRETELDIGLKQRDAEAVGVAGLAIAKTTIARLVEDVADFATERQRFDAEMAAIATDRATVDARLAAVVSLKATAAQAEQGAAAAVSVATDAASRVTAAASALRAAREANVAASGAANKVLEASTTLERRTAAALEAEMEATAAEEAHRVANEELDSVRRTHAAAHAAAMSRPGDRCPVCQRTLPSDFVRPTAPEEEAAGIECRAAETRAKDAGKAATAATTYRDASQAALAELISSAQQAVLSRDAELALAAEQLGPVDLSRPDTILLAELRLLAEESTDQMANARAVAQTARDAVTSATAEADSLTKALAKRASDLGLAQLTLERREAAAEATRCAVAMPIQPAAPMTVPDLEDKLALIRHHQEETTAIVEELAAIRASLVGLRSDAQTLRRRRRDEVDNPAGDLRSKLEVLADRGASAAVLLDDERPPARPTGGLAADTAWAVAVVTIAERLCEACSRRAAIDAAEASDAAASVTATLELVRASDEIELESLHIAAATEARVATKDLQVAEEQAPICADLDRRVGEARPFVDALDELARLLADGKFVGAVVKRKQRALLGVASELLGSMTAGRFGFSDAFQVVDQLSGQPRDVKTLSGGETFLASLALGLALIELAGRGGGRLDALFLDEGFGSLDANALSEALDALASQAEGGRLVAVISHLRAVAENIDHVLVVTKGPTGSDVHWAGRAERNDILEDDVSSGLLA